MVDSQERAGVYQDLDSTKNGRPGKAHKSKASNGGGGVYQPLKAGAQEAPSTYQVCSLWPPVQAVGGRWEKARA